MPGYMFAGPYSGMPFDQYWYECLLLLRARRFDGEPKAAPTLTTFITRAVTPNIHAMLYVRGCL